MAQIRAVRVRLTDEQRARIRVVTGEDVEAAVIAAPVPADRDDDVLEGEVSLTDGGSSASILWNGTTAFLNLLGQYPRIQENYEAYVEHPLDPQEPAIALLI